MHCCIVLASVIYHLFTDAAPYINAYFGLGVSPNMTNFLCYGNESRLLDCLHTTETCSLYGTAGVHCLGDVVPGMCMGIEGLQLRFLFIRQ